MARASGNQNAKGKYGYDRNFGHTIPPWNALDLGVLSSIFGFSRVILRWACSGSRFFPVVIVAARRQGLALSFGPIVRLDQDEGSSERGGLR